MGLDQEQVAAIASDERRTDEEECRQLEAFVADLAKSRVDPKFVLLPPSPVAFAAAEKVRQNVGKQLLSYENEAFVRELARKYHIRVVGSLDPRVVGVEEDDYVDEVHLRRDALQRLLEGWKRGSQHAEIPISVRS